MRNIRVEIDLGCTFHWTDDPADGVDVFATIPEARRRAILTCQAEADEWLKAVRDAKDLSEDDIL